MGGVIHDQKDHWEECLNDCLLAVWNNPERFDVQKGDFKAFLCVIAKYKAIDLLRRELKKKSKEISMYEEESVKEIKQLYQEERGFLQAEEDDASDEELEKLLKCLSEEDIYVTHVDQEKQGKDITIILKDVIASDQQLRCSVLVTNKDKTKTKLKDVQIEDIKINNKKPEENRGYAVLGKENIKTGNLHFVSVNYKHQEMLLNPKISLQIRIKNNLYHFKFTLKNQKFKRAAKTIKIGKKIKVRGQMIQLDKLIVTPIDQIITITVPKEGQKKLKKEEIFLTGTNQKGDKVYFQGCFDEFTGDEYLYGTRENDDQLTYELDEKEISYNLKTEEGQKIEIKP